MVNFDKLLDKSKITKPIDPIEIFKQLEKENEKEYLRNSQKVVLEKWFSDYRDKKDSIIKLPTGQGKTLIGLLILQSSINEGKGPAIYLCPNNYLVDQTYLQAKAFGFNVIKSKETKLKQEFLNSEAIFITTCSKLFNGKSVFGIRGVAREFSPLGAIVVDDAHKCLDIIRETYSIKAKRTTNEEDNPIYHELWLLFEDVLKQQALGTFTDIVKGHDCLMAVPHWAWYEKQEDVLEILSKYQKRSEIEWAWNLIKNHIHESSCIFSGSTVEIAPRLVPIDKFPSFIDSTRRIFLSATLNEDAFLIRDMAIEKESVFNPISSSDEKYSGERLVLLPTLVDPDLSRLELISWVQSIAKKYGEFGVVAITPSEGQADSWKTGGSQVTLVGGIENSINQLNQQISKKVAHDVTVLVNAYDGVDLPDNTCRILTLDSLPRYNTLIDEYNQEMRPNSSIFRRKLAQRVEQGIGRAIRGSGDWCIVIIVGNDISNFLSEKSKRAFLSPEAQMQITIGEELADEMKAEGGQIAVMESLLEQCINRDDKWKIYYNSEMSKIQGITINKKYLDQATIEREAELMYRRGLYKEASDYIQYNLKDLDSNDQGWYLQLMSIYMYPVDVTDSMDKQLKAHIENPSLFRPPTGVIFSKRTKTGTRTSRIFDWIKKHESYNATLLEIDELLSRLNFGTPSKKFEKSLFELGEALGFVSSRPELEYGKGPDNLWNIQGKEYWVIECKNEVQIGRPDISKDEIGQNWSIEELKRLV